MYLLNAYAMNFISFPGPHKARKYDKIQLDSSYRFSTVWTKEEKYVYKYTRDLQRKKRELEKK